MVQSKGFIKRWIVLLLVIVFQGVFIHHSTASPPAQTGYEERLEAYLREQMESYQIPGLAGAIVRNGDVDVLLAMGAADNRGQRVTPHTPFLLASLSKSFTAVAVMQLVGTGKLALDDPVGEYLPWLMAEGDEPAITVRQLLYHESGFSELDGRLAILGPAGPEGWESQVRDLSTGDLAFDPGEQFAYSNLNYMVLGLLIQEVSGMTYEAYIRDHILSPLEMGDTHTSLDEALESGAADGFYPFLGVPVPYDRFMPNPDAALPAAGIWASASDISRYLMAHLSEPQIYQAPVSSLRGKWKLHEPGARIEPGLEYAMGWYISEDFLDRDYLQTLQGALKESHDLTTLWHEGDWANYKSVALMIPSRDLGVALLMNTNDPAVSSALRFFAWDMVLIATGGEAQYFPPSEGPVVRNSRWIFGGALFLLVIELFWSLRVIYGMRKDQGGEAPGSWITLPHAGIMFLADLVLVTYIFGRLLPDNDANLRFLFRYAPDLGIFLILLVFLAAGWGSLRTAWFVAGQRKNFTFKSFIRRRPS